jgi:two-component system cell cycle response regulator DivK
MPDTRILYIEDDFSNRLLIRRVLTAEGYDLTEADNAMVGIDMAISDPPDLILMDINMPEIDGFTATQRLRDVETLKNIPIVALTANVMQGDKEKTLKAGCDGYIQKPVDIDKLPDEIRRYLKKSR